jgi:hypothetical protein
MSEDVSKLGVYALITPGSAASKVGIYALTTATPQNQVSKLGVYTLMTNLATAAKMGVYLVEGPAGTAKVQWIKS